jgi:reverse gyrase
MLEVIHEIKLSPFKTLKIALFCLQIIHCSRDDRVYELVFDYLHVLQDRVHSLLRAKKNVRTCGPVDLLGTSKECIDKSWEVEEMDLSSIILERIVTPLICFQ